MSKQRIFEGIRVLDFSRILAGPYCTRLLADMGAEIIKIEPPVAGDPSRHFPFLTEEGISGYFMQQNCGKKSISLDFRQPQAKEIAKQLAGICDVVVENFRPGVMTRLGLGYEALSELNPSLIMCSISGFGQYGPYAHRRGGDQVAQAMSGIMWMNGERDGPPLLVGYSPADTGAGIHAFGAIAGALYYRERTGLGQHIDISLLDCMFAQLEIPVEQYVLSKGAIKPTRYGNSHSSIVPVGVYRTLDGYVVIAGGWGNLVQAMGKPELAQDQRFDTPEHRVRNQGVVYQIIGDWVKGLTTDELVALLDKSRTTCARVVSIEEIVNDPQIKAREMLVEVDHPVLGPVKVTNSPFRYSLTEARLTGLPPLLGEHNQEVLESLLGYSTETIALLLAQGALDADEKVAASLYQAL